MDSRRRNLMGANALLYFGPLLAGLAGYGWAIVPVFVALFLLWQVILQPREWPRSWRSWQRSEALIFLATRSATQLLMVLILFGIGRGMGGVLGALPPLPPLLPVALSFLAIPLARLVWDPWKSGSVDQLYDAPTARRASGAPTTLAVARRLAQTLCDLPDDATDGMLCAHLAALAPHLPPDLMQQALLSHAQDDGSLAARRAAILHATLPDVARALLGQAAPSATFATATRSPELLGLYAERGASLLHDLPQTVHDFPDASTLLAAAQSTAGPAASALKGLAESISRLSRQAVPGDGR